MSVNGIIKAGSYVGNCITKAKTSSILDDINKIDDAVLDNLIKAQQKAGKGIYAQKPYGGTSSLLITNLKSKKYQV